MAAPRSMQNLLDPVGDASGTPLPPRFAETLGEVRTAIARCAEAGFPDATVLAALVTELMPRLVATYGAEGAAAMLRSLAEAIIADDERPPTGPWHPTPIDELS